MHPDKFDLSPGPLASFETPNPLPIVTLSHFPTPAPNKAFQPFWSGEAHEMVGVLDDNLLGVGQGIGQYEFGPNRLGQIGLQDRPPACCRVRVCP
jgi:hypothetical protein